MFWEMSASRSGSGAGPNPLSPSDILAWSVLSGVRLSPFDFDAIRAMDRERLAAAGEQTEEFRDEDAKDPEVIKNIMRNRFGARQEPPKIEAKEQKPNGY